MTLPASIREEVEARLGPIRAARAVGGGCVNPALRLDLADGPVFLKYHLSGPAGQFAAEAEGLRQLRAATRDLRVPEVLEVRDDGTEAYGGGWIALEWLEPVRGSAASAAKLGHGLAALHRAPVSGWGWTRPGFIGPLPQDNSPARQWARFWHERRLEPQLRRARAAGHRPGSDTEWERLFAALPHLLDAAERDGPSLLHGDLWSGNVLTVGRGEPALVDPSAYHGHREVDLAMSELFGGFDPAFHAAYREAAPLLPGYQEVRRPVYQLYYLLVHVNLFGQSYLSGTVSTLRRAVSAA